jgi:hypothetical protein
LRLTSVYRLRIEEIKGAKVVSEEMDGFFATLICSPKIAKPNEYLRKSAEKWPTTTHSPTNKN